MIANIVFIAVMIILIIAMMFSIGFTIPVSSELAKDREWGLFVAMLFAQTLMACNIIIFIVSLFH